MFQQDNAFIVFLNKLADMVILSVLFCLCCLPVFTIGAADAALYHTVVKVLRHNQGYAFATFRDSFKENFRQSVPATLLFLLAYVMFGATCYFCYQQPDNLIAGVYVVFSMLSILLLIFAQLHYFALLGRFNLSKKERQTLTVRLTFRQLLSNFLLLCILIFAAELGRLLSADAVHRPGCSLLFKLSHSGAAVPEVHPVSGRRGTLSGS